MTKIEGEQELVLGNKQLLSAFFIVVVLLGVFFTMGYVIGRNTASAKLEPNAATASTTTQSATARPEATRAETVRREPPVETPVREPEPVATGPVTQPAKPYGGTDQSLSTSGREEGASVPVPSAVPPSPSAPYLQVAALKRPEAEMEVKVLREHKFPALLGESSKEGLFRVLVGPFPNMQVLARTKAELKSAGFDSIVQK